MAISETMFKTAEAIYSAANNPAWDGSKPIKITTVDDEQETISGYEHYIKELELMIAVMDAEDKKWLQTIFGAIHALAMRFVKDYQLSYQQNQQLNFTKEIRPFIDRVIALLLEIPAIYNEYHSLSQQLTPLYRIQFYRLAIKYEEKSKSRNLSICENDLATGELEKLCEHNNVVVQLITQVRSAQSLEELSKVVKKYSNRVVKADSAMKNKNSITAFTTLNSQLKYHIKIAAEAEKAMAERKAAEAEEIEKRKKSAAKTAEILSRMSVTSSSPVQGKSTSLRSHHSKDDFLGVPDLKK